MGRVWAASLVVVALAACDGRDAPTRVEPDARRCAVEFPIGCGDVLLPALDGAWIATGRHVAYHQPGPTLGDVAFTVTFTATGDDGCYQAAADVPAGAGTNWPNASGTWSATATEAALPVRTLADSGQLAHAFSICAGASGQLTLDGRSGYVSSGHTSFETMESFTGTLARP